MMFLQNKKYCAKKKGWFWIGKEVPKEKEYLVLEEEEGFSSGYGHLSNGHWGGEQSKGVEIHSQMHRELC